MKVSIQTLGCKVNQSESSSIEGTLNDNGYEVVKHSEDPDICIINTCTVTKKSDYQSRQLIRRAVRSGAKVVATGCYAQLRHDELSRIEGLDLIVGNSDKAGIVNRLDDIHKRNGKPAVFVNKIDNQLSSSPYSSSRSRAFLKIQDGCNSSCSYCIVPMARGRSRSLKTQDVIDTVGRLVDDGYKEIVISGIHIGYYGLDLNPESSLLEIVKKLSMSYPHVRLRLSSIEPKEFDNEFLHLIKDSSICTHLHIPLQSGSDRILKRMKRGYSTSFFENLIKKIVSECPGISIGTDIITGFPGEEDDDFMASYELVKRLPLSYLHVFPYSGRPGTPASEYEDQVNKTTRKDRARLLIELGNEKKKDYISMHLGKKLDVIIESKITTSRYYSAISDNYIRANVKGEGLIPGQRRIIIAEDVLDDLIIGTPVQV